LARDAKEWLRASRAGFVKILRLPENGWSSWPIEKAAQNKD
jgi:hypothetical protein